MKQKKTIDNVVKRYNFFFLKFKEFKIFNIFENFESYDREL